MNNYFIILASGQSKRFNSKKAKQYIIYKNKPLFAHSLDKAIASKLFKKIIVVVNNKKQINRKFPKNVIIIKGGKERSDSSLIGLKYIKKFKPINVLIHDAARPNFSLQLLKNLVKSLKKNKAVIPTVNTYDSIKYKVKKQLFNLNRDHSFSTQTPQAFRFKDLYNLSLNQKAKIQDEATLFIENNLKVKFIRGENSNHKITYIEDIKKEKHLLE
jgi:4-diphosphocytidyl-2-methyl-D-erithritol synthase